jgi:hypothetical protein
VSELLIEQSRENRRFALVGVDSKHDLGGGHARLGRDATRNRELGSELADLLFPLGLTTTPLIIPECLLGPEGPTSARPDTECLTRL